MNNHKYLVCKVCKSDHLKRLYTSRQSGLSIHECDECGLVFVDTVLTAVEQQALYSDVDHYRAFAEAERSLQEVHARHRYWLGEIERQFQAGCRERPIRLLDVGCGVGDLVAAAREHGFQSYGLDISPAAAQLAAEWHGLKIDVRTIKDDPRDGFFDVVTMIGLLEHVLDPVTVLQHAYRLLHPGGMVFVYTPVWGSYDLCTSLLARISGGRLSWLIDRRINQAHLQIFRRSTLLGLLGELGLETLTCAEVCEYNLPVSHYLVSMGLTHPRLQSIVASSVRVLIDRRLFFRNNMCVTAQKP